MISKVVVHIYICDDWAIVSVYLLFVICKIKDINELRLVVIYELNVVKPVSGNI